MIPLLYQLSYAAPDASIRGNDIKIMRCFPVARRGRAAVRAGLSVAGAIGPRFFMGGMAMPRGVRFAVPCFALTGLGVDV